ncbi:MAG: SCO family protein [Gammaproteobacteria bacterium]|nr:SCO family protein [Gammaproteobacteria bacterium]
MPFSYLKFIVILLTLLTHSVNTIAIDNQVEEIPLAPGYGALDYQLPEPGSYDLPVFKSAADGQVLTTSGKTSRLLTEFDNKYVLMGFVYSSCDDVNGCPLTSYVFYELKSEMEKDPVLAERFKLISLSFDPDNDTPDKMKLYANNFKYAGNTGEWQFLTTASQEHLKPILKDYNQSIQQQIVDGKTTNKINHILRVFLIDPKQQIRNIYSVSFLHADAVLNDLKTLIVHEKNSQSRIGLEQKTTTKTNLSSNDSKILGSYEGKPADLMSIVNTQQLGLPVVKIPESNPITFEKVNLGRKLFFERRLSFNNTVSCAICHVPQQGFSSNEMATAVGVEGRSVRRNSPTLYNVAYNQILFHDGREETLEQQIWGPLLAKNEMGNVSIGAVLSNIRSIPEYEKEFQSVFKGKGLTMETLGMALASYQRTLISGNSAFDQWFYGQKKGAISSEAQRGFKLFTGKAGCTSCHRIEKDYALFTDNQLHNTGHGYAKSMGIRPLTKRILLAPGIYQNVDFDIIQSVSEKAPADLGLYEITQNPYDRWKYKTPTLRNVALTAPYFHDGSVGSLKEVVRFYNRGGVMNETLDSRISLLSLSEDEEDELVAFMETLTGHNTDILISDAYAAAAENLSNNNSVKNSTDNKLNKTQQSDVRLKQ